MKPFRTPYLAIQVANYFKFSDAVSLPNWSAIKMKNFNVAIFGLDGAGKTTASLRLDRDWSFPSVGKWGFSTKKVVVKTKTYVNLCIPFPYNHKTALNLFDLGGHVKIRKIWPSYYKDVYACIFVIDANDPLRFPEAKEALYTVANDLMMSVKPFLVISNVSLVNRFISKCVYGMVLLHLHQVTHSSPRLLKRL